jgi:hypothetical protein
LRASVLKLPRNNVQSRTVKNESVRCSWLQWCCGAASVGYEGSPCQSGNLEHDGCVFEVHQLQEATMFYVGLDIHDKRIAICVLNEAGQVARRAQVRTIDEMMRILESLPERFEVCYEVRCGYGHYHDLLSPIAARVTVAHHDAAVLNGSDRILSHGAPPSGMTPNGYLGRPAIVSLPSWQRLPHGRRTDARSAAAVKHILPML